MFSRRGNIRAAAPGGQVFRVTVPNGVVSGQIIHVDTPAGLMQVVVPPGYGPGMQFGMHIPADGGLPEVPPPPPQNMVARESFDQIEPAIASLRALIGEETHTDDELAFLLAKHGGDVASVVDEVPDECLPAATHATVEENPSHAAERTTHARTAHWPC